MYICVYSTIKKERADFEILLQANTKRQEHIRNIIKFYVETERETRNFWKMVRKRSPREFDIPKIYVGLSLI